jgi:uncharacterized membrane protein YidH (DUF202 family)
MESNTRGPVASKPALEHVSDELSARRTGMSFQRTRLSADRTLMSIIRTSLSLISFGFTIFQLFPKLSQAKVVVSGTGTVRNFGAARVLSGVVMLVLGIGYHLAFMKGLREERRRDCEAAAQCLFARRSTMRMQAGPHRHYWRCDFACDLGRRIDGVG